MVACMLSEYAPNVLGRSPKDAFVLRCKRQAAGGVTTMKWASRLKHPLLICTVLILGGLVMASAQTTPQEPAADNTKVNQRDKDSSQPTADQQKNNQTDLDIVQRIRQSIIRNKSLSTYAHNVKIIVQSGMVTLKGPVRSDEEKRAIEAKAAEVAGEDKINDQLEVKPGK
jgi:hyperosmotically inducible periplasmic protein